MIKLRQFKTSDTNKLIAFLNTPEVTQYITSAIPQPYTKDDAQWWVENTYMSETIKAIEFNGTLVGCISATIGENEYNRSAEIGYWIAQEYWNKGIATQAVKQFGDALIQNTNIVRLFVSVVSTNGASIRVLEKNGYTLDGVLVNASYKNGQFFDEHLLSKVCPANVRSI